MTISQAQPGFARSAGLPSSTADLDVGLPEAPPQVALFKGTQYVGNLLAAADTITELIYELLPSTTFKVRSGQSVGETFELSELSLMTRWSGQFRAGNPHDWPDPSLFWTTLFDFAEVQAGDEKEAREVLSFIQWALLKTIAEANGDAAYPVLFQFHLNVVVELLKRGVALSDVVLIGNFLYEFRTAYAAVVAYSFPELNFTEPLPNQPEDGWSLDVEAVVEVHLPPTAADFLTWTLSGTGIELFLHFDRIVLDDDTGLALINRNKDDDGGLRFPFGGSLGDLTLTDVVINISIGGELGGATGLPIGPYHRYRQAFFTQRDMGPCEPVESLIDLSLSVGSVDLDLHATALSTVARLVFITEDDVVADLEEAIENGLEGLDDFGSVGATIAGALAPFLPDAAVLQTHDFYKPFTDEHQTFTYDHLRIEGEGQGIHILNHAPEPADSDPSDGGGPQPPDRPEDIDPFPVHGPNQLPPDVLIHAVHAADTGDPVPAGAGGFSPFDDLVLAADQRPRYLAGLEAASGVSPAQEAAVRLWLDGVPPDAIAWIRGTDVVGRTRKVAGRRVSAGTIASLDRLIAAGAGRPDAFLFATSPRWPSTSATLTSLLAPLERISRHGTARRSSSRTVAKPLQYELESPLARRKGSSVDPLWVGLSVNVIAVTDALEVLVASDTLGQSGTAEYGGDEIPFRVDLEASRPTVRVDLSGLDDSRPVVSIDGLTVHFDEERRPATYAVGCRAPMDAVKPAPGCLPDGAIGAVVYNRSCMAGITGGGKITDAAYLDELIYRYFVHLRFDSTYASVTSLALTAGEHVGTPDTARTTQDGPDIDPEIDDEIHLTVQELIVRQALQSIFAAAFTAPVVFDPYYARSPVIQSFDAKDGWLNIYERHS